MNESIELAFKQGSSDKVYKAELKKEGDGFVVNFAYGRRGSAMATGTKTDTPIEYDLAKKTYDKLVKSKTSKGYNPVGEPADTINVVDKSDTGIRPQLLNEIDEKDVEKYLNDDRYCMQEKNDGRRKLLHYTGSTVLGINKKGLEVPVITQMVKDCQQIRGAALIDGEDMGDVLRVFDMLSYPNMAYEARFAILEDIIPNNVKSLQVVETAWTTMQKGDLFMRLKINKAEGVVFKLKDAPYSAGRPASGGSQFKCKFYESASCIVSSVSDVKSSIGIAVLNDMMPGPADQTEEVGNVTVYPNQTKPKVGDIVEVKYLYYYPMGSLYQPVLLGIRDDVNKDECLLSKLKTKQGTDDGRS